MNRNSPLSDYIDSYLSRWKGTLGLPREEIEKAIYQLEEARWKRQGVFLSGNGAPPIISQVTFTKGQWLREASH